MKHITKNTEYKIQTKRQRCMFHVSCFMFHDFRAKRQSGVTLVELLVAMSIFTVVVTIVIAIFISMVSAQKKSASAIDIDDTSYIVLESMTKEMRTGKNFSFYENIYNGTCSWSGIGSGCNAITFVNYHGQTVIYQLNTTGNQIEKKCIDAGGNDCYAGGSPIFRAITPLTINVSYLSFNMDGQNNGGVPDNKQMRVVVVLKAETVASAITAAKREIILQTTVSSREPDS